MFYVQLLHRDHTTYPQGTLQILVSHLINSNLLVTGEMRGQEKVWVCRATYITTANEMQRLLNSGTGTIIHPYAKECILTHISYPIQKLA